MTSWRIFGRRSPRRRRASAARLALCACAAVGLATGACRGAGSPSAAPAVTPAPGPAGAAAEDWFVDAAGSTGLVFQHYNGMTGALYLAEIMGAGVALFDYDNDGDLDVYAVQGQVLGTGAPLVAPPAGPPISDRLFRNDLSVAPDGTRHLHFTDVTSQSGIDVRSYGMGVAVGDIDNDGFPDLFLTRLGGNVLLRNNGNGTFTDVTRASGVAPSSWGVSASFFDADRDGWLDLYVGNYVTYRIESDTRCYANNGAPAYCSPKSYRAETDRLYHNRGDGTFEDVTAAWGIAGEPGPSLGVTTADVNGDGWPDIYVANDGAANRLWINTGRGRFEERGLSSGAALSADGKTEGSMGVDAGDFDNDGDEDLFMTNIAGEGHDLLVNDGRGAFEDRSSAAGLGSPTLAFTGFGAAWIDADNDGWLDLLTVNGAIQMIEAQARRGERYPLRQRKQIFRNVQGRFENATGRAGAAFAAERVGRGAAFGDIDNDGDVDVLVSNNNGPLELLLNTTSPRRHWLGVRLVGAREHRDLVGARVVVERASAPRAVWRRSRADGSYASASDPRVLVGLGDATERPGVRVLWPDGRVETWRNVEIDRWHTFTEGTAP